MQSCRSWPVIAALALSATGALAQGKVHFESRPIAPGIFELVTQDDAGLLVKVIASVGDDGLLIVDSGSREHGDALLEALSRFNKGMPRYVVNTHSHAEHLGGQVALGKGPVIIGHKNLRDRYINGLYVFNEHPLDALPQVTFTDSLSLDFNGEEIRLIAFPGAHDNSDIIVHFTRSRVVCTGALCNCTHFPSVDGETGDVTRYPETAERILRLLPDDVLLVPGHAEDCDMATFRSFVGMLRTTSDLVRDAVAKGKPLEQLRQDDVLAPYKSYESYMSRGDWLRLLYTGLTTPRPERGERVPPYGLLFRAQQEKGADGVIQVYNELKVNQRDSYFITEDTLLFTGRRVVRRGSWADGIRLLETYMKEYPKGQNMPLCHLGLASAHEQLGHRAEALKYYRLALEGYPDEPSIIEKIKELEAQPAPGHGTQR